MAKEPRSWPILLTFDPDPPVCEVMEEVTVLYLPQPDEDGKRWGEPQVVKWTELGADTIVDWMIVEYGKGGLGKIGIGDLRDAVVRLKAAIREVENG